MRKNINRKVYLEVLDKGLKEFFWRVRKDYPSELPLLIKKLVLLNRCGRSRIIALTLYPALSNQAVNKLGTNTPDEKHTRASS